MHVLHNELKCSLRADPNLGVDAGYLKCDLPLLVLARVPPTTHATQPIWSSYQIRVPNVLIRGMFKIFDTNESDNRFILQRRFDAIIASFSS